MNTPRPIRTLTAHSHPGPVAAPTPDGGAVTTDGPRIPLDHRETQVVALMGHGWSYKRIAERVGLKPATVAALAVRAASKFDNPDGLSTQMLLTLYAAHQRWERERRQPAA